MSAIVLTMDVARPYSAVVPSVDGDALTVLAGTTQPLTGREVAKLAHRSQRGVNEALGRLVDQGVVLRQEAGASYLHELNRRHVAAPAVEILAGLRGELLRRLRETIGAWQVTAVHASLFGSAARGDGDTHSDIDLLVVRPGAVDEEGAVWRSQIEELTQAVFSWTGNHAGIAELSEAEFNRLAVKRPPILEELRDDGIDLLGVSIRQALRARKR